MVGLAWAKHRSCLSHWPVLGFWDGFHEDVCLDYSFIWESVGALHGNEIWERFTLCFMIATKRPNIPVVRKVHWRTVQYFTALQAACTMSVRRLYCVLYCIGNALFTTVVSHYYSTVLIPLGYIYPALLTALVPFRSYVISRWFDEKDLEHLDPFGETEQEYHDEQKAIHVAQQPSSFDALEDHNFPNRAEFRPQGLKKELSHRRHTIDGHSMEVELHESVE